MKSKKRIIRGIASIKQASQPSVVSIGNFDGVHLGHQSVIKTLLDNSQRLSLPSSVITFEPLAREYFTPECVHRLCSLEQRVELLFNLGVEQVVVIDFDKAFSQWSEHQFIEEILIKGLGVRHLTVGDDFRFGRGRKGSFALLQNIGEQQGFGVSSHDTLEVGGERVSSGRIREALMCNDFSLAEKLLGRPYSIQGVVSKGQQLGRTIGYPTANVNLDHDASDHQIKYAVNGVYAVAVEFADGRHFQGMANVGSRPTVNGSENRLEVHIFDFSEDCYEQIINVQFCQKIREEQKFASIEKLQQQIALDEQQIKLFFG